MAFNEELAQRVRERLVHLPNIEEKAMMGGLTFMYNGKMCVGIIKDDLMCRIHPDLHDQVIEEIGCRTMDFTKRPMRGYVMIDEEGYSSQKAFDYWINLALEFNPLAKAAKKKKSKKTKTMKTKTILGLLLSLFLINTMSLKAQVPDSQKGPDKLVVIWSSDDPDVAERVALMYTHAAKKQGWFANVTLIVWGPSAKLTAENLKIQEKLKAMQNDGVVIEACMACANSYNVAEDLKKLGIDVKGMGAPLTYYLKSGAKVLTF